MRAQLGPLPDRRSLYSYLLRLARQGLFLPAQQQAIQWKNYLAEEIAMHGHVSQLFRSGSPTYHKLAPLQGGVRQSKASELACLVRREGFDVRHDEIRKDAELIGRNPHATREL